ncbi:MAG: molybdenum ABC transporter ATP-binding protein [Alphaproteobacteria bacterium]|jgi:molybdate transport system ATP-binding protein|nr:molybdenum ABC transporter ATP-binding protein [Alphaproteobacteria bacterium]
MVLAVDIARRLGGHAFHFAFEAPSTGLTALAGPSGAGKTTCINLIAGMLHPDAGRIALGDRVLFDAARRIDLAPERRAVGYVFQDAKLFPHMTVRDNLLYGWRRRTGPRRLEVDPVVDLLGLAALLGRRPATLSGGERQRVALGRALLSQPDLLLMDEPLAALDPNRRAEVLPLIERLRDTVGLPILYVSHNLDEVTRLADHVVVVDRGRTVASGEATAILNRIDLRPLTGATDLGAVIDARITAHLPEDGLSRLDAGGTALTVLSVDGPVGGRVRLRLRARDIAVARSAPTDSSVMNVIPCRLAAIDDRSTGEVILWLESGTLRLPASITRPSLKRLALQPGDAVFALVKSMSVAPAGGTAP